MSIIGKPFTRNLFSVRILSLVTFIMASYVPVSGEWPDPRKESIVFIANPIEAELPGHWMPLSVIKKHIEMRVYGRTTFPDITKYSKHTTKIKRKLVLKSTKKSYKNHQDEDYSDTDIEEASMNKAIINSSNRLLSDGANKLMEAKIHSKNSNPASGFNKKAIKAPIPSIDKKILKVVNIKEVKSHPRAYATLKPNNRHKPLQVTVQKLLNPASTESPDAPLTKALNPPPTGAPKPPLTEAPKLPPTEAPNLPPTETPNPETHSETPNPPHTETLDPPLTKTPDPPPTEPTTVTTTKLTPTPTGDPFY